MAQVAELTASAMGGSMKFEDALAARLDLIKPSKKDVRTRVRVVLEQIKEHL